MEQKTTNGLGIASLVLGIIALLFSCCYGGAIGVIGLILGLIALSKKDLPKNCAIGGIVTSIIAIVITVIVVSMGKSFIDNFNNSDDTVKKVTTSQNPKTTDSTDESSNESSTEEKEEKEEKEENNKIKVGDTVETNTLRIKFISAEDYSTGNDYEVPKDGYKYIRAKFEIENIGDSDEYISDFDFEGYADDYSVDPAYIGDDDLSATLSSGKKVKGSVYIEVPKKSKKITLEYETNFFTEKKIVFIIK